MKMIRDQARKENKSMKSNAKGMKNATKKVAVDVADNVTATTDDIARKVALAKDSFVRSVQTVKANAKGNFKKANQIKREFSIGGSKDVGDGKHIGHDAARKVKHY